MGVYLCTNRDAHFNIGMYFYSQLTFIWFDFLGNFVVDFLIIDNDAKYFVVE